MDKNTNSKTNDDGHVSVIYFHGMGNQRRYEEVSRLVDSIDIHLSNSYRQRGEAKGYLKGIRPLLEAARWDSDSKVCYIRTCFRRPGEPDKSENNEFRFYEAYWAPIMAHHSSAWRVLIWIFRQFPRPLDTFFANWRQRQRLRRSSLVEIYEDLERVMPEVEKSDVAELVEHYHEFAGPAARRDYPKGKFEDFKQFLREKLSSNQEKLGRILVLCERWLKRYQFREIKNGFLLFSLALMILFFAGTATGLILFVLRHFSGWQLLNKLTILFPETVLSLLGPTWATAIGLFSSIAGLLGIGKFLELYMGDVESWTTYEETDKKNQRRKKVIHLCADLISHVLNDPECKRVVFVSHSLGTTVAHDSLLEVVRNNRAHTSDDPMFSPVSLNKIKHFLTLASPIDKVHYFFESYKSDYHRYKRVVEELRGDIGDIPFSYKTRPQIHWINYWDEADIISGALHSPADRFRFGHLVDNVHVSNLRFPNPAASHTAYFKNRRVIGDIFDIIFKGKYEYAGAPTDEKEDYDYESAFLADQDKPGRLKNYGALALSIPWLASLGLVLKIFNFDVWTIVVWSLTLGFTLFLGVGLLITIRPKNRLLL